MVFISIYLFAGGQAKWFKKIDGQFPYHKHLLQKIQQQAFQ